MTSLPSINSGHCVYFASADGVRVKVGLTQHRHQRVCELATKKPGLGLLGVIDSFSPWVDAGPENRPFFRSLEGVIHETFAEERIEGEWFSLSPRMLGFIERATWPCAPVYARREWPRWTVHTPDGAIVVPNAGHLRDQAVRLTGDTLRRNADGPVARIGTSYCRSKECLRVVPAFMAERFEEMHRRAKLGRVKVSSARGQDLFELPNGAVSLHKMEHTPAARLIAERRRACWSQARLAKRAKVSKAAVSMLETDDRVGRPSTWEKLADALDTTPAYLLFGVPTDDSVAQ